MAGKTLAEKMVFLQTLNPTLRAILGGFLGTVIITVLMYAGPIIGVPRVDVAGMLGRMITNDPSVGFWLGMLSHFIIGSLILSLVYAKLFYQFLHAVPWLRGAIYGMVVWFLFQIVGTPMTGGGFFSAYVPEPTKVMIISLIGHLAYGVVLGILYGEPSEEA